MTKFFAVTIPAMFVITLAGWASAQEPTAAPRCAVAKSTTIEHTADGKSVLVTKTVKVCK